MDKVTTNQVEISLMYWCDIRRNIVVDRIKYINGLFAFEADMLMVRPSGYMTGFEIKVSKADFNADKKKPHFNNPMYYKNFRHYYYVVADNIVDHALANIPEFCGLISAGSNGRLRVVKQPPVIGTYKLTAEQQFAVARLGALRILGYKVKDRDNTNMIKRLRLANTP